MNDTLLHIATKKEAGFPLTQREKCMLTLYGDEVKKDVLPDAESTMDYIKRVIQNNDKDVCMVYKQALIDVLILLQKAYEV